MTRVLHVVSSVDGGELRRLARVAVELAPHGVSIRTIVLVDRGPLSDWLGDMPSLDVRPHAVSPGFDIRGLRGLRGAVDEFEPQFVHATGDRAARDAAWIARGEAKLIVAASGDGPRSWWKELLHRRGEMQADAIAVDSTAERDALPAKLRSRACVVPPGVAAQQSNGPFRARLLEELGLDSETRLIGTAGPLVAASRVKDLIWAADLLKCVRDDVHLVVLGDGPQRWRLERYRRQVEITDRVHFLGRRADEAAILAALDFFWLAASDRLSYTLLEAMSDGVPVVVADTPEHRELISSEKTGCLVPVGDRASLARRTQALLDNLPLARSMGEAGRAAVLEHYPLSAMLEGYTALYGLTGPIQL
jgi:glycosyltransferase involved in cell wall biosynthesis